MQTLAGRRAAPAVAQTCMSGKVSRNSPASAVQRLQITQKRTAGSAACFSAQKAEVSGRSRGVVHAAAQAEAAPSTSGAADEGWFALVANAEFMLYDVQNESFAEQLREKARLYKEQGKDVDFFLVSEPAWLDENFPSEAKRVGRPCVALVCKNKQWAVFMKLRLDRVLMLNLGDMPDSDLCKSKGPVPEFPPRDNWIAPYSPYSKGWWEPFMKNE